MADYRASAGNNRVMGGGTGRRSQPGTWTPYNEGGIGIIPRRGLASPAMLRTHTALGALGSSSPLRLLTHLLDADPDCSLAAENILTLTTGDVKIVASARGGATPDEGGSEALDTLWEQLPDEVGGLEGLHGISTLQIVLTGMSALEAVPGPALSGVARIWPVDTLTLLLTRESRDADISVYQRQGEATSGLNARYPGYVAMNPQTFCWRNYQAIVDDPYGRAVFAPAIAEILSSLHVWQALRDCVDHSAWPRGVVEVDTTALYGIAQGMGLADAPDGSNPAASEWVLEQFQAAVKMTQDLKSDDWMVLGANGKAVMMQPGSFGGLEGILDEIRSRIIRGLKQLPVMMAFNDAGSTEGHTSVQWGVYARRLESIRSASLAPILKAANLHLRLLGKNLRAKAQYEPIRTTDALVEANTEATRIGNAAKKAVLGWITDDQACAEITGKPPSGTADPDALHILATGKAAVAPAPEPAGNPQEQQSEQDEPDTQEELDTQERANARMADASGFVLPKGWLRKRSGHTVLETGHFGGKEERF